MGKVQLLSPSCFAMETRGLARHSSRKENYSAGREGGEPVLTSYEGSSLVVDQCRCMLLL